MASVDFHAQCESYVRISVKDLNGLHGGELSAKKHPSTWKYPNVPAASCELAAGHPGECEMFVDGTGAVNGEPYLGYWIAWHRRDPLDELQDTYRWVTNPACCQAQSAYGYHCNRYANHGGGHVFSIED